MARVDDHQVAVAGGTIPVRVLVPPQGARGVIVYLHGGGWVIGAIDEFDTIGPQAGRADLVRRRARRLPPGARAPLPDRRRRLLGRARTGSRRTSSDIAGRDDVPLIVAGDSAGGNLAAVMALRARDRGGPQIALQVLIYPVTDADFDRPSYVDPENQLLLTRDAMVWFWDHYVPDAERRGRARRLTAARRDPRRPAAGRGAHRRARRAARRGRGLRRARCATPASPSTSAATTARPTASSPC